jgi:hypothetical protein
MKMDPERTVQVLRILVKEVIRAHGIMPGRNLPRRAASLAKELNERYHLEPSLKGEELLGLYIELGEEVAKEHFNDVALKASGKGITAGKGTLVVK